MSESKMAKSFIISLVKKCNLIIIMRNKQLSKMLYNNSSNSNKMNNHSEREIDNDFDENIKKISKVNESVISSLDKDINNFIKKEKFIHDLKK